VASIRLDGVRFAVYSNDHPPRHVHGFLGETEVIVNLLQDGSVGLAERSDVIRPSNAKRSDVRRILQIAAEHFELLAALWERVRGNRA
jgi:Domain of unknown function (DUF4160)